ncbi:MAG: hypothetical protein HYU99_08070 [Deltaproteobacteria bacterium]|nr:hypothetical protein [Deltaproteobacteria bacterium]
MRVGLGAEPDTLNPITSSDAYSSRILSYVNDSLIQRDNDTLEYKAMLAKSWEISDNHLMYTFVLRDDVFWHDGKKFTADDVVYSFEKIKDPKVEAPFLRVYYDDVIRVEKLDDYRVKFVTKRPYFLGLSVCGTIPLIPKHIFDDGGDFNAHPAGRNPLGTGPYRFLEWKTNKRIVLVLNENYWGKKPAIDRMEFKIVTDDAIAIQVLKKGEIDYANMRPIQWVKQTGSQRFNEQFNKFKYLLPGFNYIGWNGKSPFFSDKRVRRAMTLMVDRQKLLEKINYGRGQVVESPFFVGGAQYNKNLKLHPHDPAQALQLLQDAGWRDGDGDGYLDKEGKKFSFTFLYPAASKFSERVAPILKEDLKKIGIEMNIEKMEWAAFLERIEKKKFDATALGWSTGFEDDPYQLWHSSQAKEEKGSNFVSFENKEADELIEKARIEFDEGERNALYYRFQEILYEEQPYTFLFASDSLVAVAGRFKNVKVHPVGLDPLEWEL